MKTIIAAIDFSEITPILVDKAAQIAKCTKASVYIIHVASPDPDFVGYKAGPEHERDWRAQDLKAEKHELEKLADIFTRQGVEAIPLLIQKTAAEGLVSQVERLKPDMLIMGRHGHGVLSALLGSTSQQVIKRAKCPILLIPYI